VRAASLLEAHPRLEIRLGPLTGAQRPAALFLCDERRVVVSARIAEEEGLAPEPEGWEAGELNRLLKAASPLLVHELVHAGRCLEASLEVPVQLFEDELLATAWQALHLDTDSRLKAPRADQAAFIFDEFIPLAEEMSRLKASIEEGPGRTHALLDSTDPIPFLEAEDRLREDRRRLKRLIGRVPGLRTRAQGLSAHEEANGPVLAAFRRGWTDLARASAIVSHGKPYLPPGEDEALKKADDLRRILREVIPAQAPGPEVEAFLKDPEAVGRARAYYEKEFARVRALMRPSPRRP